MTDRETITLRWTGQDGVMRRVQFEPRQPGGHTRIVQRWTGEEWHTEGQEIVSDVGLDAPAAIVTPGGATLR